MKVKRNPEQLCMLCVLRKANKTGSHFVPAGLLKGTIGARDYEEAHTIDPKDLITSSFYGQSNLKNTDPEIKPHPHVEDYIFCNVCEDNLGKIESEIIPILDKEVFDAKKAVNYPEEKITDEIRLITCQKVNSNIFNMFVYSLVWRIAIQQRLDHQFILVSATFDEGLRKILNNNLEKKIEELKKEEFNFDFPYVIITCDEIEDKTATYVNPNVEMTNPYLFYVGKYLILINHEQSEKSKQVSTLPPEVLDKSFRNGNSKDEIKIVKVSKRIWDEVNYKMVEYAQKNYSENMITSLAKQKRISLQDAAKILQQKADELNEQGLNPSEFFVAINQFYDQEMKS